MASFPNAKKTFSAVVNGVAALFNTPYDEIEAIETFIGAMGSTQANTDSLKNLLLGYYKGCDVAYKGAADLYVRAGEIAIPDASGNLRFRRNTSDLTVDWTNIDTGSEAGSTQYYVYAVADAAGTTFTVKISTNATTPTGCTFYRLIGTFYNDASSNIINPVSNLSVPTGSVIQIVNFQTGAVASISATIPYDDSIPQITEGAEVMTLAITPKSATNKLKIDVIGTFDRGGGAAREEEVILTLFQDAVANALAVNWTRSQGWNVTAQGTPDWNIKLTHFMTAGTINPIMFRVRAGASSATDVTFNGHAGSRLFGGITISSITITEIKA